MTLVVSAKIIAVDNANGVVEPQAVLKAKSASGAAHKEPTVIYPCTYSCGDSYCFVGHKLYGAGNIKVIACGA